MFTVYYYSITDFAGECMAAKRECVNSNNTV